MKSFDNAIKRINEIQMPESYRPMVISAIQKISKTFDTLQGLNIDLDKLFEEKLFNNLKIEEYSINNTDSGESGRYDTESNTIFMLSNKNETYFCHEFIHFLIHNLYSEQFTGYHPKMPMWLDEAMTQSLTNEIMETPRTTSAYRPLLSLSAFIQRNIGVEFSYTDFLNGEMPNIIIKNNLEQFERDLDCFTHNYTNDSGYEARSKVISHFYEKFIDKQLSNPNIKVEELISNLAQYEVQTVGGGYIDPFAFETVGNWLTSEDRDNLFKYQSSFNPSLLQKLIFSKNIRAVLSQEQAIESESFVETYLSYLKKQILNKNGGDEQYSQKELLSNQKLPQIKQMLNNVCQVALLKEKEQKDTQSLEAFLEDTHQTWISRDAVGTIKNINNLNNLKEIFNSQLQITERQKSPVVGNSYFMIPLYQEVSNDSIKNSIDISSIEDLQKTAESLQHGDQSNIIIEINGEPIPVGNIAVTSDDVGIAINWKGVWQHLPKEIQSQIQDKINEKNVINTQDKF